MNTKTKTKAEEPAENLGGVFDGDVDGERQERPPSTAAEWLRRAISMAAQWETRRRECGEAIAGAMAADPTITQAAIAACMGRSLGWVNGMCQWIKRNYQGTPFGEGPHSGPESGGEEYVENEELRPAGKTGGKRKRKASADDKGDEDKKLAQAVAETIAGCMKLAEQTPEQLAGCADSRALLALYTSAPKLGDLAKAAIAILAANLTKVPTA
jgi:hypothetical protein